MRVVRTAFAISAVAACASCLPAAPTGTVATPSPDAPAFSGFPAYAATAAVANIDVHAKPAEASQVVARLGRRNENGAAQTFLLKRVQRGTDGRAWYNVLLPVRRSGSTGWIRADDVELRGLRYALVVHLASFRLDLLDHNRKTETFAIGVGADNTPAPSGRYYVKELIQPPNPNTVYGRFVLGLSGFSNVLRNWPDGGVIGIHGTRDPNSIGRRAGRGCIRLSDADITRLAKMLPLGTPVAVEAD